MKTSVSGLAVVGCFALLACSGADDRDDRTQPSGRKGEPDPALVQSCERFCFVADAFFADEPCTPGDAYEHGVPVGSEIPPEPPISDNQECIDECVDLPEGYCWQEAAANNECWADALWVCDVDHGWNSVTDCGSRPEECAD